jgi:hypothetical protein
MKSLLRGVLMGGGLGFALANSTDGVILLLSGFAFGLGLHWHMRKLGWRSVLVACLMSPLFVTLMGMRVDPAIFGLLSFVLIGGVYWGMKK